MLIVSTSDVRQNRKPLIVLYALYANDFAGQYTIPALLFVTDFADTLLNLFEIQFIVLTEQYTSFPANLYLF